MIQITIIIVYIDTLVYIIAIIPLTVVRVAKPTLSSLQGRVLSTLHTYIIE